MSPLHDSCTRVAARQTRILVMRHIVEARINDRKYTLHEMLTSIESGSAVAEGEGRICASSSCQLANARLSSCGQFEHLMAFSDSDCRDSRAQIPGCRAASLHHHSLFDSIVPLYTMHGVIPEHTMH